MLSILLRYTFLIAPLITSSSSYSNQKLSYEKVDQVFLQILLFSTVSFMFLAYNQLSILSVLPLNLSSAVYSAGSIPSNHSSTDRAKNHLKTNSWNYCFGLMYLSKCFFLNLPNV